MFLLTIEPGGNAPLITQMIAKKFLHQVPQCPHFIFFFFFIYKYILTFISANNSIIV